MEVHHPHHPPNKKKWTEYLLEFFMLFLAVFLGFIAENIRETLAEKHREKEYVHSMIEDLKIDTTKMRTAITMLSEQINGMDSLVSGLYSMPESDSAMRYMYYLYRRYSGVVMGRMVFTMRTIDQLKNAGGMHLIRNKLASESIVEYYAGVETANTQITNFRDLFLYDALQTSYSIFDWSYLRGTFRTNANQLLRSQRKFVFLPATEKEHNKYIAQMQVAVNVLKNYQNMISKLQLAGNRLISFLQKEYPVEDE